MNETEFTTIEEYVKALREAGITKIAFSETKELRPRQEPGGVLQLAPVRMVDLLAYRKPVLYKCRIDGGDIESVHRMLEEAGFELKRFSRNIV